MKTHGKPVAIPRPGKGVPRRRLARSAADFLPADHSLPALQKAARSCQGCELFRRATQVVFGEGPASAALMLVGEVPGDKEDQMGRPFVGPAGRLLDEALATHASPELQKILEDARKTAEGHLKHARELVKQVADAGSRSNNRGKSND